MNNNNFRLERQNRVGKKSRPTTRTPDGSNLICVDDRPFPGQTKFLELGKVYILQGFIGSDMLIVSDNENNIEARPNRFIVV